MKGRRDGSAPSFGGPGVETRATLSANQEPRAALPLHNETNGAHYKDRGDNLLH